jgi:hypothetical protein
MISGGNTNQRITLPELLVAVPIFHLIVCSLFLIGYYGSYGYGISVFAGPSDLFTVSIADVGPSYITTIAVPTAYILWTRARTGAWSAYEANLQLNEAEREVAEHKRRGDKRFLLALGILAAVGTLLNGCLSLWKNGYIPYWLVGNAVMLLWISAIIWFANKIQLDSRLHHFVYLIGFVLIVAGFSGLSRGQADRRASFENKVQRSPRCGDLLLIRPLASFYLSVHRSGRRVIIDSECKVRFVLPR